MFVVSPYCSQSGVVAEHCKDGKGEDSHGEDQRPEPEVFELEAANSGPTALGTAGAWRPRFGSDGFGTAFGGHWGCSEADSSSDSSSDNSSDNDSHE